jgi:Uri superfamily endonuclease
MIMRPDPGTYAIVLRSDSNSEVQVGRWGRLGIDARYYVYIGSAFGPGGVRARVGRHLRKGKKKRWHIDYLREQATPVCVWCSYAPSNREHEWAKAMASMPETTCVKGFGCSDCRCDTHLFAMATQLSLSRFSRAVGGAVEVWYAAGSA